MHLDSVCMGERRHNNPQTCWGQVRPRQSSAEVSGISRREALPRCARAVRSPEPRGQRCSTPTSCSSWVPVLVFLASQPAFSQRIGPTAYVACLGWLWELFRVLPATHVQSAGLSCSFRAARSWGSAPSDTQQPDEHPAGTASMSLRSSLCPALLCRQVRGRDSALHWAFIFFSTVFFINETAGKNGLIWGNAGRCTGGHVCRAGRPW